MHIFITGVGGFLGSNLANFYLKKNFKVSGCDNLIGGNLDNVDKRVHFYKIDCENLEEMTKATKNVDVICHAAAIATEGLSVFSPVMICKSNVLASTSTFTAGVINKVKRIIFCSSMARYGKTKIPYKEEQFLEPCDPYGISKVAAEKILINLSETHKFEYNIAVPHNIIGPNQKYDDPYRNVVSIMINLMLQNRRPIIYGDGEQKRSFSDVEDCIYCLDKLITDKNIISETVNIGPDEEQISINELYKKLSNKLKFNLEPLYYPERMQEVKNAYCDSTKARKLLGYNTSVSLDESLNKIVDFIMSKGAKKFDYMYKLEINNENTPETWKNKVF
jgi:UDP-glucose 4-epimerase